MELFNNLIIVLISFVAIWLAARLIVATVADLAHLTRLSAFAVSFFILGFGTSLPEFFISVSAALDRQPEIFAGTLLGATIVIFLFVIPLLAILGGGILTDHQLKKNSLIYSLFVIFLPFLSAIDGRLDQKEGLIMIVAYVVLFYVVEMRQGFVEKIEAGLAKKKEAELFDMAKIVGAALVLYFAAQLLVAKTVAISQILNISPFLISIIILGVGTDIPETCVAMISAARRQKTIAMGDYLGSAGANTLILGVLTLMTGNFTFGDPNFLWTFLLFGAGLLLFFIFARSKNNLSRKEGLVLLLIYALFIGAKIVT